jgi:hypothetical protein
MGGATGWRILCCRPRRVSGFDELSETIADLLHTLVDVLGRQLAEPAQHAAGGLDVVIPRQSLLDSF